MMGAVTGWCPARHRDAVRRPSKANAPPRKAYPSADHGIRSLYWLSTISIFFGGVRRRVKSPRQDCARTSDAELHGISSR